jgi:ADP-ribose pyrophosphatase
MIKKENINVLFESRYVRVYDLQYGPDKHYYNASRRAQEELVAVKTDEEFQKMLPDAVSCFVILQVLGQEPRILFSYEYRYPAGRFLLSVPAGLVDKEDGIGQDALIHTAIREIQEEAGLLITGEDTVKIVNPLVFSTPGMTDESNALVCVVLNCKEFPVFSQEGASGSELFDGFCLLTKEEARKILKKGTDYRGGFYSVYTWAALMYFVSDMWKEE